MTDSLLVIAGRPLDAFEVGLISCVVIGVLLALLAWRAAREQGHAAEEAEARARDVEAQLTAITSGQAELAGRLSTMAHLLGERQSDLHQAMTTRLDAVSHRVGQSLVDSARFTGDHLTRLNERLAIVEGAGQALGALADEVGGLKSILANKQSRGAFGQARLEAVIADGLPPSSFAFQATLSNGTRPDCIIRLPSAVEVLVIDAKFPLEAITQWREAGESEASKTAEQRVRADLGKHIDDIARKYFIPGETQDVAMMFVPSESIFADIQESFPTVVEKAFKMRVILVSPSLLMLAIHVVQSLVRDARMRDEARRIQVEVSHLLEDVRRVDERAAALDKHFKQAGEDVSRLMISTEKVTRRGLRIATVDLSESEPPAERPLAAE